MSSSPLLSVIVPIYNSEKYIAACLDSIAKQSIPGLEVICVDDGSTDRSGVLTAEFVKKDPRFRVIHQDNRGRSAARNTGIDLASGRYIAFIDSDDTVGGKNGATGEEFNILVRSMEEGDNVDFANGNLDIVYEVNQHLEEPDRNYYKLPFSGLKTLTGTDILGMHCSVCTKVYRKSVIDRYQLRFPEELNYEDAYWHFCFSAVGPRCIGVSDTVYTYYRHPSGIMNTTFSSENTQLAFQHVKIAEATYHFFEKNQLVSENIAFLQTMFEMYYRLALFYSPKHDALYVMWATGDILRKLDMDTSGCPVLEDLKQGKVEASALQ